MEATALVKNAVISRIDFSLLMPSHDCRNVVPDEVLDLRLVLAENDPECDQGGAQNHHAEQELFRRMENLEGDIEQISARADSAQDEEDEALKRDGCDHEDDVEDEIAEQRRLACFIGEGCERHPAARDAEEVRPEG